MSGAADATTRIALLGNPNCGKTALFNLLTGARQKVANYAGVTVERKEGRFVTPKGRQVRLLDLPGTYSLHAQSADEAVTREVMMGQRAGEAVPELLVCVTDATRLRLNLRLVLEARELGLPMLLVLNMCDMAEQQGIVIDRERLAQELGMPVVSTTALHANGAQELLQWLDAQHEWAPVQALPTASASTEGRMARVVRLHDEVRRILAVAVHQPQLVRSPWVERLDALALHPLCGTLLLASLLFLMFQAVFSWAAMPMEWIEGLAAAGGQWLGAYMADGPLRGLLLEGVIAGAGGVLVFLPQILILFLFILVLEESGYLPRAAFLLDRLMGFVGLSGRSFIPLLSSFACAVPGIMATRSIPDGRDRLVTILIAPLMTCSARLPVYTLLIAAFVPERTVAGVFNLQGLVLFALYVGGIVAAMLVAWLARWIRRDATAAPLLMELPAWRWPSPRNVGWGLWERARIFIQRVGGIILAVTVLLWFLSSYPAPPDGATGLAIEYSFAGRLGAVLALVFAPIGFNWQICIALVPGMAAREVVVSALGTVYAIAATGEETADQLLPLLTAQWSLATALSLLVWFIFAPQCISTIAAVRRETNSWRWPALMTGYLFALAWTASFVTYRAAVALGWG